jgi:hypothetical protein
LTRYREHTARFEVAARRDAAVADVIPLKPPRQQLEQDPTAREIEVLQLISDFVNARSSSGSSSRGTVKNHVRHLLASFGRSQAHAVASASPPADRQRGRRRPSAF